MNYNSRAYPHPVLGVDDNYKDDFDKNTFKPILEVSSDYRKHKLEITFQLKNDELLKLISHEKAVFCTQLYCRSTMFRQSFLSKKQKDIFEIPSVKLRDDVMVDFLICANEEIKNYSNSKFNDVYTGISFEIERGDILSFGGNATFFAHKSPEELKSVSSFMSIDTQNKQEVPMHNEYESDKITIILSQEDYNIYQVIQKENIFVNTLHSSIVLPALSEAIRFISEEREEFSDKKWYILLSELVEKNQADDPLETAQKILDLPVNRAFNSLYKFLN